MKEAESSRFEEYFLKPGYIYIPRVPTLISAVIGSCVAVCLWDRKQEYGGMSLFLYPYTYDSSQATARFGNVAIKTLMRLFLEEGSKKTSLEAQIFGGAHPYNGTPDAVRVSEQNIAVARQVLSKNGVSITSEDVGGNKGRKVVYNTLTNEVVSLRVERLRESDWHPYTERT